MRKRKYLIAAMLGVCGTLVTSAGTASAAVIGQNLKTTMSPARQDRQVFAPAKTFRSVLGTSFTGARFLPIASANVLTFSKDVKFTPGNIPECDLSVIRTVPEASADAACRTSRVGGGSLLINGGGALTGKLAFYNGQPIGGIPTIGLHTDVFTYGRYSLSTTLTGVLNTKANTLSFSYPPTGNSVTDWDTTFYKRKSGKETFYVMARCRKKWVTTATVIYDNGQSISSTSTQRCKQKPLKK